MNHITTIIATLCVAIGCSSNPQRDDPLPSSRPDGGDSERPDAPLVFASNRGGAAADFDLWERRQDGSLEKLTELPGLALDPDRWGDLVVFTHRPPAGGNALANLGGIATELRLLDLREGKSRVLLERSGLILTPRLGRGGTLVAFACLTVDTSRSGGFRSEVFTLDLSAPAEPRHVGEGSAPEFWPGTTKLVFNRARADLSTVIVAHDLIDDEISRFSAPGPRGARFSPSGAHFTCIIPEGIDGRPAAALVDSGRTRLREVSFGTPSNAIVLGCGWSRSDRVVFDRVVIPGNERRRHLTSSIREIDLNTDDFTPSRVLVEGDALNLLTGGAFIAAEASY